MAKAEALSNHVAVLITDNDALQIMEAQQEFETDQNVQVSPAKSIWLNTLSAKRLQTALNEHFGLPKDDEKELMVSFMSCRMAVEENERMTELELFYKWKERSGHAKPNRTNP